MTKQVLSVTVFLLSTLNLTWMNRVFGLFFMYIGALHGCMSVCHVHSWYYRTEKRSWVPLGAGLIDNYKPSSGCCQSNLGPLKEQPVILTAPNPGGQFWVRLCHPPSEHLCRVPYSLSETTKTKMPKMSRSQESISRSWLGFFELIFFVQEAVSG